MPRVRPWSLGLLLCLGSAALAHAPSTSFLTLDLTREPAQARWDIALRDLEYLLGLDADADGAITWGELQRRHGAIAAYALARLQVDGGQRPCTLTPGAQQVADHGDGAYTVLPLRIDCGGDVPQRLDYRLLFASDPTHRALLQVTGRAGVATAVLSPGRPTLRLGTGLPGAGRTFGSYWREGVRHIWIGFDHLLFLFALLLPSVLRREHGHWRPVQALRPALRDVLAVITAFTLAHSLTLGLAAFGVIALPSRWVEAAIAATVILAALNNLYPLVPGRRWAIAFALGLVHGLGFASALGELGLPEGAALVALAGFNLGVEAGQLAIVALFVPLAYLVRDTDLYRRGALGLGSTAVAALAGLWLTERSLDLRLLNF